MRMSSSLYTVCNNLCFVKCIHRLARLMNVILPYLFYSYEVRSRRGTGNKVANEKQKLRYKYKKEFKVQPLCFCLC